MTTHKTPAHSQSALPTLMHVFTILTDISCKSQTYRQFISITTLIDTLTAARQAPHTTVVTNVAHINTTATNYYLCTIVTNYDFRRQIN